MRYGLEIAGAALATTLIAGTSPQAPGAQQSGNMELRLQADAVERRVPQGFTFLLVNRTDHDVRVPMPTVGCNDSFNGEINLKLVFTPLKPGQLGVGGGCACDTFDWPPIMDRIKSWRILRAAETISLKATRNQLHYDGQQPGKYEFWGTYSPPYIDPSSQKTLQEAGVDFPRQVLTTKTA